MEKELYKQKLDEYLNEYETKKKALHREYALSNNPYKIGDKVTDHIGTIKIDKIQTYLGLSSHPQCVYTGVWLKKDGKPNAKNETRTVYQEDII